MENHINTNKRGEMVQTYEKSREKKIRILLNHRKGYLRKIDCAPISPLDVKSRGHYRLLSVLGAEYSTAVVAVVFPAEGREERGALVADSGILLLHPEHLRPWRQHEYIFLLFFKKTNQNRVPFFLFMSKTHTGITQIRFVNKYHSFFSFQKPLASVDWEMIHTHKYTYIESLSQQSVIIPWRLRKIHFALRTICVQKKSKKSNERD